MPSALALQREVIETVATAQGIGDCLEQTDDSGQLPADADGTKGIWRELGDLPPGAIVSEAALADMFGRCTTSIKRAVKRGELPPATRLMGMPVWTVSAILRHLEARLDAAKMEAEQLEKRIGAMAP